jgi:protocatechuate 3,4-dioxygenase beta subunit
VRLFILAFSLLLVSTAFALQTNLPQQTPTVSIRGKVLQESGEQPIRKAKVQLNGRIGPYGQYSAISDSEGQFVIDDVQPGQYVVVVERPGFVQSSGHHLTTISVQPDTGKNDLIFHMQPAAVITGKIVDSDGDPMPGVGVSATSTGSVAARRNSNNSGYGATNDLGEFRISDLRPGRYKITASPPRAPRPSDVKEKNNEKNQPVYLTTHYPGVLAEEQAAAVEIQAGAETRISFGMLTGKVFLISGTVTGIPGEGTMSQLMLMLIGGRGSGDTSPQKVGEGGKFEFANILPGTYSARLILVTFDGGRPEMQMLRLGQPIEVTDANVEGLRLQPEPPGLVRGKFRLDTTDQKFDWGQLTVHLVTVEEQGGEIALEHIPGLVTNSVVNTDGTFEMKNVPGGTYQLVVGARSNTLRDYFTKSVNLGGRDVADFSFQVVPETFLDVVVSANGATVAGTVVDANGRPVANATVVDVPSVEHRSRSDLYQRDTTDASGHFSLRGLNPGKYTVLAFEELQQDVRQPEFLKTYETRGEVVQLDEGVRKSVILKLISSDSEAQ